FVFGAWGGGGVFSKKIWLWGFIIFFYLRILYIFGLKGGGGFFVGFGVGFLGRVNAVFLGFVLLVFHYGGA
ncbi:hypothetical protein, partial [Salmonella enterica]|uniref:hypothetical protein n=1 Tax=Salmonella enterica TaxID=28901 RepID=UPI001F317FF0